MDKRKYEMHINLNVLNHLGLNLYSNVPAVLSEVIANSWDADATHVDIEIAADKITITDDGHGMSEADINEKYLNVGYERRKAAPGQTARYNRTVMGRKGIGKLSLFSIADTVEVQTVRNGEKNGFVMSAKNIASQIQEFPQNGEGNTYYPDALPASEVVLKSEGTRVVLTGLKQQVSKTPDTLRKQLARRFCVIGTEYDFDVVLQGASVNGAPPEPFRTLEYLWYFGSESAPYMENCDVRKLAYGERRDGTLVMTDEEGAETARYHLTGWIGTVRNTAELTDGEENLNKIVVMVRGKLAQEDILADFSEGGLYTKYLIGEIHADFLDRDDSDDIATTNRQEIIKDDPRYRALQQWVRGELKHIQSRWTTLRTEQGAKEASQIHAIAEWLAGLNRGERRQAKSLFGKIGQLTLDEKDKVGLYQQCVLAFENIRYKGELEALERITPENLDAVTQIFAELDDIEASLYYRIVQERLRVIKALHTHVADNAKEKVVQEYLYEHLWLLEPSWDRATETPLMEQSVQKEFAELDADLGLEEKRGRFDIKYKMTSGKHVIIELKRADRVLDQYDLLKQVEKYGEALRKLVRATGKNEPVEIVCIVGRPLSQWTDPEREERAKRTMAEQNVRVVLYDQLIEDAYRSYQAFLDKNREAGRVYRLIRNIEHESGGGPDEPNR